MIGIVLSFEERQKIIDELEFLHTQIDYLRYDDDAKYSHIPDVVWSVRNRINDILNEWGE